MEAYLRDVLERIAEHPINRVDELLPWNLANEAAGMAREAGLMVVMNRCCKIGCTTEGANFRDLYKAFAKLDAVIVGCSRDSLKSHENFKAKMEFPFELVSDADEALCKQFDVIKMKNMYGKQVRGIERSTFVIDAEGKLAREWRGVKVPGHAQDVLEAVKALG